MVKAIYANTWDGLTVKMLGYYHDHCYHLYTGICEDLPEKYCRFKKKNVKFVFLYEEPEPLKFKNMNDKMEFNIEETRNLDECMDWVKSYMCSGEKGDEHLKDWLLKSENEGLLMFHHGFGTFIRNTLKLWHDGPAVRWFNENGIYHADDMSSIIFKSLHRRENGNDIKLDEQIKRYRDYWNDVDPNVNKGIKG